VVMFASLPHAVNVFSKTSDQYNIVTAFLHFNTLQAVQFVQYTVRHNKYSQQTTNVTLDGSCSTIKISSSLLSFYTGCISLFFTKSTIFLNYRKCLEYVNLSLLLPCIPIIMFCPIPFIGTIYGMPEISPHLLNSL